LGRPVRRLDHVQAYKAVDKALRPWFRRMRRMLGLPIRRKQLPGSSCNCSRRRLQKLAGSSDCVIQGCTFST
jgi:hypothetical protein